MLSYAYRGDTHCGCTFILRHFPRLQAEGNPTLSCTQAATLRTEAATLCTEAATLCIQAEEWEDPWLSTMAPPGLGHTVPRPYDRGLFPVRYTYCTTTLAMSTRSMTVLSTYLGSTCLEVRLSVWWRRNNVSLPLPPPRRVCKMFGSIFAAEPRALLAHPLAFWQRLLATHAWAAPCYQLENMWQPLLVAADSRRRPRQRDTGG